MEGLLSIGLRRGGGIFGEKARRDWLKNICTSVQLGVYRETGIFR